MMQTLIALLIALALDYLLGEPKRWHPLVGFGQLVKFVERHFHIEHGNQRLNGILSVALLLAPLTVITAVISNGWPEASIGPILFESFVLYLTLGARSLSEHARQVHKALSSRQTGQARLYTSYLVSRDTSDMSEQDMSRATIESTLENGCDAVFAPLFWFLIGGAPAALFYRLANTLDAMWGYRTARYLHFGWAAARLDDLLNFIPARLTALTYAIVGQFHNALSCWRAQAPLWKSPNAGPVMSSGAGALTLQLGGPAHYHGELQQRPSLGKGLQPTGPDILRTTKLLQRGLWLWSGAALLIMGGLYFA